MKTHHVGFEPTLKCVVNQHRFGDVTSNLAPEVLALVIDLPLFSHNASLYSPL